MVKSNQWWWNSWDVSTMTNKGLGNTAVCMERFTTPQRDIDYAQLICHILSNQLIDYMISPQPTFSVSSLATRGVSQTLCFLEHRLTQNTVLAARCVFAPGSQKICYSSHQVRNILSGAIVTSWLEIRELESLESIRTHSFSERRRKVLWRQSLQPLLCLANTEQTKISIARLQS